MWNMTVVSCALNTNCLLCTFCTHTHTHTRWRSISPQELVLEEFVMDNSAGAAPFRLGGFRIITDKNEVKRDGDFLLDVAFEVLASKMKMVVIAVLENALCKVISKVTGLAGRPSRFEIRMDCSEVRMDGTLRLRIRPKARLVYVAFTEAPSCILAMTMTLQDKLTGLKKEVPVTAFPAIPTLLQKVIQMTIADFMVWPRYYLFNLTPPEALGMVRAYTHIHRMDVRLID